MCALNTFNRFLIKDNLRYFSIKKKCYDTKTERVFYYYYYDYYYYYYHYLRYYIYS